MRRESGRIDQRPFTIELEASHALAKAFPDEFAMYCALRQLLTRNAETTVENAVSLMHLSAARALMTNGSLTPTMKFHASDEMATRVILWLMDEVTSHKSYPLASGTRRLMSSLLEKDYTMDGLDVSDVPEVSDDDVDSEVSSNADFLTAIATDKPKPRSDKPPPTWDDQVSKEPAADHPSPKVMKLKGAGQALISEMGLDNEPFDIELLSDSEVAETLDRVAGKDYSTTIGPIANAYAQAKDGDYPDASKPREKKTIKSRFIDLLNAIPFPGMNSTYQVNPQKAQAAASVGTYSAAAKSPKPQRKIEKPGKIIASGPSSLGSKSLEAVREGTSFQPIPKFDSQTGRRLTPPPALQNQQEYPPMPVRPLSPEMPGDDTTQIYQNHPPPSPPLEKQVHRPSASNEPIVAPFSEEVFNPSRQTIELTRRMKRQAVQANTELTEQFKTYRETTKRMTSQRKTKMDRQYAKGVADATRQTIIAVKKRAEMSADDLMRNGYTLDKELALANDETRKNETFHHLCLYRNKDRDSYINLKQQLQLKRNTGKDQNVALPVSGYRPWHMFTTYNLDVGPAFNWTPSCVLDVKMSLGGTHIFQLYNLDEPPSDFDINSDENKKKYDILLPYRAPTSADGHLYRAAPKEYKITTGISRRDETAGATMAKAAMLQDRLLVMAELFKEKFPGETNADFIDRIEELMKFTSEFGDQSANLVSWLFSTTECCEDLTCDLVNALTAPEEQKAIILESLKAANIVDPSIQTVATDPPPTESTVDDQSDTETASICSHVTAALDSNNTALEQALSTIADLEAQVESYKRQLSRYQDAPISTELYSSFNMADELISEIPREQAIDIILQASLTLLPQHRASISARVTDAFKRDLDALPSETLTFLATRTAHPCFNHLILSYGKDATGIVYPWNHKHAAFSSDRISVIQSFSPDPTFHLLSALIRPYSLDH
jgi:hypothetical protein